MFLKTILLQYRGFSGASSFDTSKWLVYTMAIIVLKAY
jgi:hypothetical protein